MTDTRITVGYASDLDPEIPRQLRGRYIGNIVTEALGQNLSAVSAINFHK